MLNLSTIDVVELFYNCPLPVTKYGMFLAEGQQPLPSQVPHFSILVSYLSLANKEMHTLQRGFIGIPVPKHQIKSSIN